MQDDAAVHLELGLTRTSQSHRAFAAARARTASLAFQVGPQSLQAGQHIAVLRQLHLGLGIGGLRPHGEDVEDERGAVEDFHLQHLLDVAQLLGRELVVEDHHAHHAVGILLGLDVVAYLLEFAFAHIGHRRRAIHPLREAFNGEGTGGVGQEFQLVEILFGLGLVLVFGDQTYENGGFGLRLGYHKFFHSMCVDMGRVG